MTEIWLTEKAREAVRRIRECQPVPVRDSQIVEAALVHFESRCRKPPL